MIRKSRLYAGAQIAWGLLVGATFVLLYSGQVEPIVSTSQLPGPLWLAGAVAAGAVLAGWIAIARLQVRSWLAMGAEVGLAPDAASTGSLSPLALPDLTGTVDGRRVRVRTVSRTVANVGGDGTAHSATSTIVEAELDAPADDGAVIARREPGPSEPNSTDFGPVQLPNEPVGDRFVVLAGSPDLARAVLTPRTRDALLEVNALDALLVGDAGGVLNAALESMVGGLATGALDDSIGDAVEDDPATVGNEFRGKLLSATELDRQIAAVVAVADSFETVPTDAAARTATGGDRR